MDLLQLLDQMGTAASKATTLETLDNLTDSLVELSLNSEVAAQDDAFWDGYASVCYALDRRYDKLYAHRELS